MPNPRIAISPNKPSIRLYVGKSGVEATWSGTILLPEDGSIKWTFSLQNGLNFDANTKLTPEILEILKKLQSFYDKFKKECKKYVE